MTKNFFKNQSKDRQCGQSFTILIFAALNLCKILMLVFYTLCSVKIEENIFAVVYMLVEKRKLRRILLLLPKINLKF